MKFLQALANIRFAGVGLYTS